MGLFGKDELEEEFDITPAEHAGDADPALVDLLKQQKAAQEKKGWLGAAGSVMQGFADVPTGYEMIYNKKLDRAKPKEVLDKVAAGIEDPMERSQKAHAFLKNKREQKLAAEADSVAAPEMVSFYEGVVPSMKGKFNGMTGAQLEKLSPVLMAKFRAEGDERMANVAAKARADEKRDAKDEKLELEKKERTTPFGVARTPDDAKNLKAASELKANFDGKLNELIELRKKHGGGAMLNREDVGRGKQLSKDLLLAYKDMAKLGVLSVSDEKILNEIIPPDPLGYNSPLAWVQGQDPTLHKMTKFKADSDRDFQTRLKNRLENYEGSAPTAVATTPSAPAAAPKAATHPQANKALEWAKANAGTPEADAIFKRLGVDPNTAVGAR